MMGVQRHKSQVCDCKVTKRLVPMQQINYSTRMIVVCVEPTEPYGGISVKGSLESKLSVRLERNGVQSM